MKMYWLRVENLNRIFKKFGLFCFRILSLWRNSLSHWVRSVRLFGSLVERIWPTPNREPHISTQEGLMGSMDYLCRCLCAGLLFPFVAYAVGYLFRNVIKTRTGRTILVMINVLVNNICCTHLECCSSLFFLWSVFFSLVCL